MNKKTIALISILVLVIGFGVYFFFFGGAAALGIHTGTNASPFGTNTGGTYVPPASVPTNSNSNLPLPATNTGTTTLPVLREISSAPVAGFIVFDRSHTETIDGKKTTVKDTFIRYIERGTGNVFETQDDSADVTRLTNTTYPQIEEAFFTNSGNSVILRSLGDADTIKTYLADIIAPSASSSDAALGSLSGDYIDDNISFVAVSPDTTKMFVLNEDTTGAQGFVSNTTATKPALVFSSGQGEWLPQWYGANDIALTTKASAGVPGLTMLEHTKAGTSETLLADIPGLTTLVNPTGTRALYSSSGTNGSLALATFVKSSGQSTPLHSPTLPEKCVWSVASSTLAYCLIPDTIPAGTYPDDWYQGVVSFTDNIWKVDTATGISYVLYQPSAAGASIDGVRPALTSDEKYLVFMNKKDGTLWSYQLGN